jgi:3-hydroxyisobutyrate dehydrogenase-like beta-hydroxyacid dehydrogenase
LSKPSTQVITYSLQTSEDTVLKTIVKAIVDSGNIEDKIIVETTTVHPNTSREVNDVLTAAGARYVAGEFVNFAQRPVSGLTIEAPVFGASPLAESAQLLFVIGGPNDAIEAITPYIKGVMGRDIIRVGEEPSRALLMKTTGYVV